MRITTSSSAILLFFVASCSAAVVPTSSLQLHPAVGARAASADSVAIEPQKNVSLHYASLSATTDANVNAFMHLPSVLLEDISAVTNVDCAISSVAITFSDVGAYANSHSLWPASDFLLFTNHLGDCDAENERGVYLVNSLSFADAALTVTASTTKTAIQDHADHVAISFTSIASPTKPKRDLSATVTADLSGQSLVVADNLAIVAKEAALTSTINLSGSLQYNFVTWKLEEFYVDVDLGVDLRLGVEANVSASYSTDLYSYSPGHLTVSAFSIPGILDVGPYVDFSVGIEFAASGNVSASVDFDATIADGKVHIDFVNPDSTGTSGWTPTYQTSANVSAEVDLQLNPYAKTGVGLGVILFSGLLDLSAGVDAKATVVNVFSVDAEFEYTSSTGVTFTKPTDTVCKNGAWFASTFDFEVRAFVTQFYSVELYEIEIPIYKSECWTWTE